MALSNPRTLADFFDKLDVDAVDFWPKRNDQVEGLGSGLILTSELATPLATADVRLSKMEWDFAHRVRGMIESLLGPDRELFVYDPLAMYPQSDPTGSVLGAAVTQILAIGPDFDAVSFKGFPIGYVLTEGDVFHCLFGSSPVQRGFFRLAEGGVADSDGETGLISITPHTLPGMAADNTVSFAKPTMKSIIIPDSYRPGTQSSETRSVEGARFSVIQRL